MSDPKHPKETNLNQNQSTDFEIQFRKIADIIAFGKTVLLDQTHFKVPVMITDVSWCFLDDSTTLENLCYNRDCGLLITAGNKKYPVDITSEPVTMANYGYLPHTGRLGSGNSHKMNLFMKKNTNLKIEFVNNDPDDTYKIFVEIKGRKLNENELQE